MIETLLALYVLCMLGMFAYSLLQLHLTFIHRRLRTAARGAPVESAKGELPLITVQLPIYNERYLAARSLRSRAARPSRVGAVCQLQRLVWPLAPLRHRRRGRLAR